MLESFGLDPSSDIPLFRQLYAELRGAILNGRLPAGTRMPSTRDFAKDLGVSRNTVLNAFDQLLAEGYVEGKIGSGTYVAHIEVLPGTSKKPRSGKRLSERGQFLSKIPAGVPRKITSIVPFRPGSPDLNAFPMHTWLRLQNSEVQKKSSSLLGYHDPAGYHPLRGAVATYLRGARGVQCDAKQVIIVSGSQQGLDLTARVCADVGDRVWTENPCYVGASGAFAAAGLNVVPVPLDEEGLDPEKGTGRPRLIYVTPSYQFPLGITMSLARRTALLDCAQRSDAYVIEDDYDSEFRYSARPIAALQGLDPNGRVIYIGTFSKVLFPGMRLGYIVVPADLTYAFVSARALLDRQPPMLNQIVLSKFIEAGYFNRHIRKMRKLYGSRQKAFLQMAEILNDFLTFRPTGGGMQLIGWLRKGLSDKKVSELAAQHGVEVPPVSSYCLAPIEGKGLLFGYAAFEIQQMKKALGTLYDALRQ